MGGGRGKTFLRKILNDACQKFSDFLECIEIIRIYQGDHL